MLGLQGSSSSSKVYRCVACSATFNGLASLLVHQATHAGALSKVPVLPPKEPSITPHQTLFTNKDLSGQHLSPPALMPESNAGSFYICDCGEEFQDFNLMLEHKRSHVSTPQLLQPLSSNALHPSEVECNQVGLTQHESFKPTSLGPVLALGYPSTSVSSALEVRTLADHGADVSLKEGTTQSQCNSPQGPCEKLCENIPAIQDLMPGSIQDRAPEDKTNSVHSGTPSQDASLPKNNTIMKLLATAYMKRFQSPQSQKQNKKSIIPKPENVPVDITPGTKMEVLPNTNPSLGQLRRLLTKPGIKTKAPAVARILDSSKKSIVSLTKTFSPVVLLETRQKLIDSSSNGTHGRYQCGRCRKVFQKLDNLTDHHFLHRKERIKCCRHCKQLIIGKLPFPDNHVCPQSGGKATQQSNSFRKLPFVTKIGSFHSLNNTKKLFFCPSCKHTYSRRYNLKMHKCQGPGSSLSQQATSSIQKTLILRSNSKANTDSEGTDRAHVSKSVAVGTETLGRVKVEMSSANSGESAFSELAWSGSPKSFSPFYPKASVLEQHSDASPSSTSLQQEDGSWNTAALNNEETDGGQWTMPLDDEMEVLSSGDDSGDDTEVKEPGSVERAKTSLISLPFFIRDGVKRYPCNRCQKTYSRPSTLRRHLRLCGFRPQGFAAPPQSGGEAAVPLNANNMRPMFDCFVCGKTFNRKDNMLAHRKKCQLKRTMTDMDSVTLQQSFQGSTATECQTQQDDGGNWGIMSLPSVLPRRVTCECGAGFTSPRLLLEHLQKHAQESYTCPTCGETVSSWADYEVHLQIHMHPHHQLYKGLQPQRSQPLLLRFQQQAQKQQPSQSGRPPPLKQPCAVQLSHPNKKQRITCARCNNTFSTRCSLRRHLSLNRCKGGRVTNPPKTNHCSRCNTDFPNTISLIFHQRSGICKPAIKPVRCPVCVRWFGTVDGLQKHLLTHNQSQSYRCDVCQGMYSTLKSLKNHRRRIHRIMAGDMPKTKQEQLNS